MPRRGEGGKESGEAERRLALVGDDLGRVIKALAALRGATEASVKLFGAIAAAAGGGAQVFFANRITDADIHARWPSRRDPSTASHLQ